MVGVRGGEDDEEKKYEDYGGPSEYGLVSVLSCRAVRVGDHEYVVSNYLQDQVGDRKEVVVQVINWQVC